VVDHPRGDDAGEEDAGRVRDVQALGDRLLEAGDHRLADGDAGHGRRGLELRVQLRPGQRIDGQPAAGDDVALLHEAVHDVDVRVGGEAEEVVHDARVVEIDHR